MSEELERLRADVEVLGRYADDHIDIREAEKAVNLKIARLEAEADPWREHKKLMDIWRRTTGESYSPHRMAVEIHDHLTAENARLEKRVKELEKEPEHTPAVLKRADEIAVGDVILAGGWIRTVTDIDANHSSQRIIKCNDWMAWLRNSDLVAVLYRPLVEAKTVVDMQPPFEGPIESIEPVLDPARVLLTAIGILIGQSEFRASASISDAMFRSGISSDKPYRLKGANE